MPWNLQLHVARQMIAGLDHLHNVEGIAHLDVKLGNILVFKLPSNHIVAKLADFGLSERMADNGTVALSKWR
jgi:serine/threonine protein kinase